MATEEGKANEMAEVLRERLSEHSELFNAVVAVAGCKDINGFLDLTWPPCDKVEIQRALDGLKTGVEFTTALRTLVIEEYGGELRYYAGGWAPDERSRFLEQDRIEREGWELGVFGSIEDALTFAMQFLKECRPIQDIGVVRRGVTTRATGTP
jgi:hypothetical protein